MDSIASQIAQGGIAFSVLMLVLWWAKEQLKKKDITIQEKDAELKGINKSRIEEQRETLSMFYKVLGFMEKMEDGNVAKHSEVISKIHEMRVSLEEKLKDLKDV
jgi:hypothetical protein